MISEQIGAWQFFYARQFNNATKEEAFRFRLLMTGSRKEADRFARNHAKQLKQNSLPE